MTAPLNSRALRNSSAMPILSRCEVYGCRRREYTEIMLCRRCDFLACSHHTLDHGCTFNYKAAAEAEAIAATERARGCFAEYFQARSGDEA